MYMWVVYVMKIPQVSCINTQSLFLMQSFKFHGIFWLCDLFLQVSKKPLSLADGYFEDRKTLEDGTLKRFLSSR